MPTSRLNPAGELIAGRRAGPGKLPAAMVVTVTLALATACAPAITTTVLHQHPPKPADSPMPIFRLDQPQCDFQEIGIVNARRPGKFTPMQEVTAALLAEARKIGGDALVGVYESSIIHDPNALFLNLDQTLSGVVIKFTDPDCAQ